MYQFALYLATLLQLSPCSAQMLKFAVMADWGGSSVLPGGTTPDEVKSAKSMNTACTNPKCDFAVGVGDNIYLLGVSNEYDSRFKDTFENAFNEANLQIPFYFCAGNHDHYGNVSGEIAYSKHSSRWHFPDYNYSKIFPIPGTNRTLQMIFIDTVILTGQTVDGDHCRHSLFSQEECVLHPKGPSDLKAAADQWAWLKATLAQSTADYLTVLGHYPVWSIAEHGPTKELVSRLRPMLFEYNVTAYIAGHDHTFEYLEEPNRGNVVGYIQAGGTHECTILSTVHIKDVPKGSLQWHGCDDGGFVVITANNTVMEATFRSGDGTSKYSVRLLPRVRG